MPRSWGKVYEADIFSSFRVSTQLSKNLICFCSAVELVIHPRTTRQAL